MANSRVTCCAAEVKANIDRTRWWIPPLLAACFWLPGVLRAAPAAQPDPIPELRGKWRYTRVAGLEVLSDCPDAKTRAYVQCVLRAVPLMNLPRAFQPGPRLPVSLILTERFLEDELAPPGCPPTLNALRVGSDAIVHAIAHDADVITARIGLALWEPFSSGLELTGLPLRFIPPLLRGRAPQLPAWAEAGLAALYGADDSPMGTAGQFLSLQAGQRALQSIRELTGHPERVLPLAELFAEPAPPVNSASHARWRAHAALFVRWGTLRKDAKPGRFWEFCARACNEPVTEALFTECFEADYATAQRELAKFVGHALDEPVVMVAPELEKSPAIEFRAATRAEICRIEGEWQRLMAATLRETQVALSAVYLARARRTLEHAYLAGDRDPSLLASLGLCYLDAGATAEARRVLEESFAGKAVRPLALRGLARLLLDETDQSPTGENGRHGSAQTLRVLRLLHVARAQPPADIENYRLLAEAWGKSEASPTSAQFAELAEAVKSHPRESALLLKIARLAARHGLHAEAARTAERGLAFALMPETRAGFTQVIAAARDRK